MAQPAFGGTDNGSVLPVQPLVQPPPGNDQVVLPSSVALDTNHAAALPANENRGKQRQKQQQQRKQKSQQPTRQAKVMTHSRIGRSKKRSKVQVDGNKLKNEPTLPKTSLHDLPLETLDLILAYMSTEGLATMLSVNRYFNHYLKDPVQSSRMWRRARESFLPCPLPPPPTDISENDYGRWLFGWLPCEICEKPTNRVPTSISLRAKLCLNVSMASLCLVFKSPLFHSCSPGAARSGPPTLSSPLVITSCSIRRYRSSSSSWTLISVSNAFVILVSFVL